MKVRIRFNDCRHSASLEDHIWEKLDKLGPIFQWIEHANVTFRFDRGSVKNNKITEIELKVPNHVIYAESRDDYFFPACDVALDRARRQLERLKTKMVFRRRHKYEQEEEAQIA